MTCNPCTLDILDNSCPDPMACPLMFEPLELPAPGPPEPMPTEEQLAAWGKAQAYADTLIAKDAKYTPSIAADTDTDGEVAEPEAWAGFSDPVNSAAARNRQRWARLAADARKRAGRE